MMGTTGMRAAAMGLAALACAASAAGAAPVTYQVVGTCSEAGGCTSGTGTLSGSFVLDTSLWVAGAPLAGAVSQLSLRFDAAQPSRLPNVAQAGVWSREPREIASFSFIAGSVVGAATGTVWTLNFAGEGTEFDGFGTETTPASCATSACAGVTFGPGFATRIYTATLFATDAAPVPVPLPATALLLGASVAAMAGLRAVRRRTRRATDA